MGDNSYDEPTTEVNYVFLKMSCGSETPRCGIPRCVREGAQTSATHYIYKSQTKPGFPLDSQSLRLRSTPRPIKVREKELKRTYLAVSISDDLTLRFSTGWPDWSPTARLFRSPFPS
jgi:hypothetical protein